MWVIAFSWNTERRTIDFSERSAIKVLIQVVIWNCIWSTWAIENRLISLQSISYGALWKWQRLWYMRLAAKTMEHLKNRKRLITLDYFTRVKCQLTKFKTREFRLLLNRTEYGQSLLKIWFMEKKFYTYNLTKTGWFGSSFELKIKMNDHTEFWVRVKYWKDAIS